MTLWCQCELVGNTWTNRGFPKRRALSRFFLKASSRKLVLVILRSLYSFMMNSVAWPDGSIMRGYLHRMMKPAEAKEEMVSVLKSLLKRYNA